MCATCFRNHFVSWAGSECRPCDDSESHAPTIILASVLSVIGSTIAITVVLRWASIRASGVVLRLKNLKRVGEVKAQIIFYTAQTISDFVRISGSTAKDGEFHKRASTFAGIISVSNLDVGQPRSDGIRIPPRQPLSESAFSSSHSTPRFSASCRWAARKCQSSYGNGRAQL